LAHGNGVRWGSEVNYSIEDEVLLSLGFIYGVVRLRSCSYTNGVGGSATRSFLCVVVPTCFNLFVS
jgi:hypothetical protein